MYRIVVPVAIFLLLSGCKTTTTTSGQSATTAPPTSGPQITPTTTGTTAAANTPDPNKLYFGNTLDQWKKQLMDKSDETTSDNAAAHIEKIGPDAAPILAQAMESTSEHVKINTLNILKGEKGREWAKQEEKSLVPLLKKALHDDSAKVRREASNVIAVLRFPQSITDLQQAEASEQDPPTKNKMKENLAAIKK